MKLKSFFLCIASLMALTSVQAQSDNLASVTPVDTVLALSITPGDVDMSDVQAALDTLDWEAARNAITHLSDYLSESGMLYDSDLDYDTIEMVEMLLAVLSQDTSDLTMTEQIDALIMQLSEGDVGLADVCAPLAEMDLEGFDVVGEEAILSAAISPFSPMPAVTAITHFAEDDLELMQEVQAAVLECIRTQDEEAVLEMEQDDTTFYVLGDGSDMPIVVGSVEEFFFISTNPDSARSVIRLAQGSDEDSYADTTFFQNQAALSEGHGYRLALDYATLADFASNMRSFVVQDDATEYLFNRGVAVLRTLNTASAQVVISEEGLLFEDVIVANPEGGDEELANLMLCDDCTVSIPEFFPADTVAASAQYMAIEPFFDYLQGWLDGLSDITGEDMQISDLANEFGVDLDTLLFDWLDDEWISAQFEASGKTLASWVYNPESATLIKVKNQEAADAGRAAWGEFTPQLFDLLAFLSQLSGEDLDMNMMNLYGGIAHDQHEYRGYELDRYRWSFNVDVTTFYLEHDGDTYLVIASPLDTAETFIDALEDGASLADNAAYQMMLENSPENATALSFSDSHANSQILTETAEVFSQPVASFLTLGSNLASQDYDSYGDYGDYDGDSTYGDDTFADTTSDFVDSEFIAYSELMHDLLSLDSSLLDLSGESSLSIEATLTPSDVEVVESNPFDYYQLDASDLEEDAMVEVVLESEDFDAYLQLVNAATGEVVDFNDDADGSTNARLRFAPMEDTGYVLEVSAINIASSGDYTLSINSISADAIAAEAETMADTAEDTMGYLIDIPQEISHSLSLGESMDDSLEGTFYLLEDLPVGEDVTIRLEGTSVDTYLRLVNADTGEVLLENDDFDAQPNLSALSFVPAEDINYAIQVSTYEQTVDDYSFNLSLEQGMLESNTVEVEQESITVELPVVLTTIALGDSSEGSLVGEVVVDEGTEEVENLSDFYVLTGLEAGAEVSVTLESDAFDTKLFLIGEYEEAYLAENDDYDGSNSFLRFTVDEYESYIIEVNEFYGATGGDYTLTIDVAEAMSEEAMSEEGTADDEAMHAADMGSSDSSEDTTDMADMDVTEEELSPLSFAEWLSITDLGHESLEVITERLSYSHGFGKVEDNTIHRRSLIHFDW